MTTTKEYLTNNPPKYENLTDSTSLEYGVSKELTEVANELQTLVREIQDLDESFIGRMKRKDLTWEDVARELAELQERIENVTDFILEKFD